MTARRKPRIPDIRIPGPTSQARRDRSWEAAHRSTADLTTVTYRYIPVALRDSISEIAGEHLVTVNDVVRAFLEYSLAAYQSGAIRLNPRLRTGRYTLFPEKHND